MVAPSPEMPSPEMLRRYSRSEDESEEGARVEIADDVNEPDMHGTFPPAIGRLARSESRVRTVSGSAPEVLQIPQGFTPPVLPAAGEDGQRSRAATKEVVEAEMRPAISPSIKKHISPWHKSRRGSAPPAMESLARAAAEMLDGAASTLRHSCRESRASRVSEVSKPPTYEYEQQQFAARSKLRLRQGKGLSWLARLERTRRGHNLQRQARNASSIERERHASCSRSPAGSARRSPRTPRTPQRLDEVVVDTPEQTREQGLREQTATAERVRKASDHFRQSKGYIERNSRTSSTTPGRASATDLLGSRARRLSAGAQQIVAGTSHNLLAGAQTVKGEITRARLSSVQRNFAALQGGEPEAVQLDDEESRLHFEIRKRRNVRAQVVALSCVFIILIGVTLGCISAAIALGDAKIFDGKKRAIKAAMWPCAHEPGGCTAAHSPHRAAAFFTYLGINVGLVSGAAFVCIICPQAIASGLPGVKAFLNGCRSPGLLRFSTLVAKVFGITMVVATALPLGREGPMVHIGGTNRRVMATHRCIGSDVVTGACSVLLSAFLI